MKGLDPSIVCAEQLTTDVKINGDGLSPLAENALEKDPLLALPTVVLQRSADLAGATASGSPVTVPDDPRMPAASHVHWTSEQLLTFQVFPGLSLMPGIYGVTVTNANGKTVSSPSALAVVPPPVVTKIAPNPVCNAQGTSTLTLTGTGFLQIGDLKPTITIDALPATLTSMGGCTPIVGSKVPAQTCTSIVVTVPQNTLTVGTHQVTVTNPAPANCATMPTFTLTVEPPPTVTSVVPTAICAGGGDLVINGTNFSANPSVIIGTTPPTVATVTSHTPTQIHATVGMLPPGDWDVIVDNQDGCTATAPLKLHVTPGPAVYFVDPPTVYNGISVQATIYVTGLLGAPQTVQIRPTGTSTTTSLDDTFDPARPNRILAVVPSGLTAGDYDVIVTDTSSCTAVLPEGLHVVSMLTVAIADITPPFAWTSEDTAVTIGATDPAPSGQVQFQATPRVYLNPHAGASQLARPVESVAFVNAQRLTGVVPSGLTPGQYDLIVVNPDRSVGLLANQFLVTAADAPPPIVDTITPGSVVNQTGQTVTVLGDHFRTPATVTATCQDDSGAMVVVDATGVTGTSTALSATFNMSPLSSAVCVVRVENSDGTYVDFSALAVSNPAQNLPPTVADEDMGTARRALGAAAGRVTSQARYLYAIGGDDGTDGGLLASVEAAPVSLFGKLDKFFPLPLALPAGRSLAGTAVIGRFIYLVGGHVASGATTSVLRAQILDPRQGPDVNDLDIVPSDTAGVDSGLWYYRVSAVMADGDASNPGGETLAGDPFGVVLPADLPKKAKLTLFWSAVPNAASYRIYRTAAPGDPVGAVKLIGTATTPRFTDDGATAGTGDPLPEGSLGVWHETSALPTAREGAGVAVAADPDDAGAFFLYAIGGRSSATTASATYTFARVVVAADGSQTVSAFASEAGFLQTARWQLGAIGMDNARASHIPAGETWVYALTGYNAGRTSPVNEATAGKVNGDGTLDPVYEVDAPTGAAGYGLAGANDFLFMFGGTGGGGAPATTAISGNICPGSGCGPQVPDPPDIGNWNNLSFGLHQARYLPGSALESAFIFLVGGQSDTEAATTTTERTHW